MGRRDTHGGDHGRTRPSSLLYAGSTFLQQPFPSPTFGVRPPRQTMTLRTLALARRVIEWRRGPESTVTCIACGATVPRADAREYDKHGDRFDRADKEFEHLCKHCHRDIDHQPRRGLEDLLLEFEAGDRPREQFLPWYCDRVEQRYGPLEED